MQQVQIIKKIVLIGLTGSGKSRFGNKSSGFKKFLESSGINSCTKGTHSEINQLGFEITDTQGLDDTDKQDKKGISDLFSTIKEKKPNLIGYVHNCANKRFTDASEKAILEICQMFKTKTVWNHFVLIFTYANCMKNKSKRARYANEFSDKILEIIQKYYQENKVDDKLPIPKKLLYYFVDLGEDEEGEEEKLDIETIEQLTDILKQTFLLPPISGIKDKIIVDIQHRRNCQESIKIYDRKIYNDSLGLIKTCLAGAVTGLGTYGLVLAGSVAISSATGGIAFPTIIGSVAAGSVVSIITEKVAQSDGIYYYIDRNSKNEDYITFDEETYIYHDGTSETIRINIKEFTRIISKK